MRGSVGAAELTASAEGSGGSAEALRRRKFGPPAPRRCGPPVTHRFGFASRWSALVALTLLVVNTPAAGRQVFRSGVDAVSADVLVTRDGRPVPGLMPADFELHDNGVEQRIEMVAVDALPIALVLALDTSESVQGEPLEHLRAAVNAAADALRPDDELALITFSHQVRMVSAPTTDHTHVRQATRDVAAGGATSLYDATFAALAMRHQVDGRVFMLVFSDGDDTTSWLDPRGVLESAQRSDVVVYGVTLQAAVRNESAAAVLQRRTERRRFRDDPVLFGRHYLSLLVEDTGGSLLVAERSAQLHESFARVVNEFRQRYVLTYMPRGVAPDGWHDIQVNVRGQRADVRARRGYLRGP